MLQTRTPTERAILVGVPPLEELHELAITAGAEVVETISIPVGRPHPAMFVGKGKAEQIRQAVVDHEADLVILDAELTPRQARNLQEAVETRVVDRTGLILDIFADRARTREGKLQVELAQLNYQMSRLAGYRTELSRLGGGIGTRGPGETRLETDRRRLRSRVATLRGEIEEIRQHRQLHRDKRRREGIGIVSLVGYTNAGKSTLFHALSGESTLVSGRMFSTLDPLIRRIQLPDRTPLLIADTVGFIRKLPHQLVSAFRATLEEVVQSDLILHVVDASDPDRAAKIEVVGSVLNEIGAAGHPQVLVYNKVDLLDSSEAARLRALAVQSEAAVVSASRGDGVPELMDMILQHPAIQKK